MQRTLSRALPIAFALAAFGCDEEVEPAVIVETATASAEREAAAAQAGEARAAEADEARAAAAGTSEGGAAPRRVLSGVEISAIDLDCPAAAVYFQTDSAELSDAAKRTLDAVADCLQETPWDEEVDLRGRADPRASEDYNEALGRQRATAIASYLQTNGADDSTFEIHAIGEEGATEGMPKLWPTQRNATVRPTTDG